jgi:hypothetical protein
MSTPDASGEPLALLKSAVKSAVALARESRWEEFYGVYAGLFADPSFSQNKTDDQRQALKLMIMTKGLPAPTTQQGIEAYQAAWHALSHLVGALHDPRDYELLGLTHLRLQDEAGAKKVFQQGLEVAQGGTDADLCGPFLRHLSTL